MVKLSAAVVAAVVSAAAAGCTAPFTHPVATTQAPGAEVVQRAESLFAPLDQTADLSGILLVRSGDETVLRRSYGFADWARQVPHAPETLYEAASVTKGLTAALMISLARDGSLSLQEPVSHWLPALTAGAPISVEDILSHRAGLPRDLPNEFDPEEMPVSAWLAANPDVRTAPGQERYSNIGYALLAELAEAATGVPYETLVAERVLGPAGMVHSRIGHKDPGQGQVIAQPYTAGPAPLGVMTPVPAALEPGSSGLLTTASDLASWVEALAGGEWPELFAPDDPWGSIDRGDRNGAPYVSVQGSLPGYTANAVSWPERSLTAVYIGNLFSYPALDMRERLLALTSDGDFPAVVPRPPEVDLSAGHRALAGTYEHPDFGRVQILSDAESGQLSLRMPDRPAFWRFHLTPVAGGGLQWRAFDRLFERDGGTVTERVRGEEEFRRMERTR